MKLSAKPDTGKPPLAVTFTIKAPKAIGWRIDFGDGKSQGAQGTPPKTLTHTYAKEGDFKPTLRVVVDAATSYTGTTSVMVHLKQLVGLDGAAARRAVAVEGDVLARDERAEAGRLDPRLRRRHAARQGPGEPPATVDHTYTKDGSYKATLAVKPSSLSLLATFATVTVGGGTPPVLAVKAKPVVRARRRSRSRSRRR